MNERPVSLPELFRPRGVAVVGASASRASVASRGPLSLQEAGFPALYPVYPTPPPGSGPSAR